MNARERAPGPRGLPAFAVVLATAASLASYGYAFGLHNHTIQIPYLLRLGDPSLYPGDAFVDAMGGYTSLFWPAVAWIVRFVPLEPAFFAGHVLTLVVTHAAIFALGRRAFSDEPAAPYAALWFHLFGASVVGGESLHWFYFAHTPVATALGLWALVLALGGRWRAAFALAGALFSVHAMQAVYLGLMLGVAHVAGRRKLDRELVVGTGLWALAASPGLALLFASPGAVGSPPDLAEILRAFFPQHFFPSSFTGREWAHAVGVLALFAAAAIGDRANPGTRRLAWMVVALVALMVVGGVVAEVRPFGALLKLHVFRASSYACTLVLVIAAGWLVRVVRARVPAEIRPAAAAALILVPACLSAYRYFDTSALAPVLATIVVVLGAGGAVFAPGAWRRSPGTVAVLGLLVLAVSLNRRRLEDPYRHFMTDYDWIEVQRWAEESTEPDDLFLTPPNMHGFRVFSERPVVGEWIDGAAAMWDRDFAPRWRGWYGDVGGTFAESYRLDIMQRLSQAWRGRGWDDIRDYALEEGASYVVLRRAHHRRAGSVPETVFQNHGFVVVPVD